METKTAGLVSIGLAVYNGEHFLREAMDSMLGQTYLNIELIISDNSSTDGTEFICREYAEKDPRISYTRQEQNIGALSNFNFVLSRAKGEYFMWASHDDVRHPTFIEKCVDILKSDKRISMAFSNLVNVDEAGNPIRRYSKRLFFSKSPGKFIRLHCGDGKANLIYGLWRTSSIRQTRMEDHWGSDMNLLYEQLLRGKFKLVDEVLFSKRLLEEVNKESKWKAFWSADPNPFHPRAYIDTIKLLLRSADPYYEHLLRSARSVPGFLGKNAVVARLSIAYSRFRVYFTRKL